MSEYKDAPLKLVVQPRVYCFALVYIYFYRLIKQNLQAIHIKRTTPNHTSLFFFLLLCPSCMCACVSTLLSSCCVRACESKRMHVCCGGWFRVLDSLSIICSLPSLFAVCPGPGAYCHPYSQLLSPLRPENRHTVTSVGLESCFSFSSIRMAVINRWCEALPAAVFFFV